MSHDSTLTDSQQNLSTFKKMNQVMPLRRIGLGLAASSAIFLAGCARNAPQDTWQPKGENAEKINTLQWMVFPLAGIVGVAVFALIAYILWRFRDRGQAIPHQSHGNPAVEITLTIIPALILSVVGVFTFKGIFELAQTNDTQMVINVTGQQWWWEYDYPAQVVNGVEITQPIITSGQLVIPTGTKVLLRETSRDVIHSYWIGTQRQKDAVPGRINLLRIQANKPGIFAGQCTEFCGLSHANMRMEAVALGPEDFAAWIANQQRNAESPAQATLAQEGEAVFLNQCIRCHQVNGLKRQTARRPLRPQMKTYIQARCRTSPT